MLYRLYFFSYIIFYVTLNFFLGREVGMNIGAPCAFKNFFAKEEREITNYFHEHKHLKLIIVLIPDNTDVTYGEYIILFIILSHSEYKSI